jgi:hypothetical protein
MNDKLDIELIDRSLLWTPEVSEGQRKLAQDRAWPVSGQGGTLSVDGKSPGPYYRLAAGDMPLVGKANGDLWERAVHGAVLAYQRALKRRGFFEYTPTGVFGSMTKEAVTGFQTAAGLTVWGGIGPDTSKALLMPDLIERTDLNHQTKGHSLITPTIICGGITIESIWDAGAVGDVDPQDIGLAQINGPAHPELTEKQRLQPMTAFDFVFDYLAHALDVLDNNIIDAVVSYNLGIGGRNSQGVLVGCKAWIADGRPDLWTPPGSTTERDIKKYYTNYMTVCES